MLEEKRVHLLRAGSRGAGSQRGDGSAGSFPGGAVGDGPLQKAREGRSFWKRQEAAVWQGHQPGVPRRVSGLGTVALSTQAPFLQEALVEHPGESFLPSVRGSGWSLSQPHKKRRTTPPGVSFPVCPPPPICFFSTQRRPPHAHTLPESSLLGHLPGDGALRRGRGGRSS